MASIGFEDFFRSRMNPQMTLLDPNTGQAQTLPSWQVTDEQKPAVTRASTSDPFKKTTKFKDTSKGTIDSTVDIEGVEEPKITAKAVEHYADACAYLLKGGAAIANGYIARMSADSKKMAYRFKANQNRRAADLLLMNQVDITRAAQMDSNQYRIAGVETKSKQVTGMAASGFAVGKGVYKNTLNTTEARVNYNVANLMLRADLQNAELTRKAGQQVAESVINDANAEIAKIEGKAAVWSGWINGISNFISAGASFYCGKIENGGLSKKTNATNGRS
jgi:hypothetical protein